jgi:D-alanine-D-alanine ligase
MVEESRIRVAVVMGGVSGERDVSMVTGACVARRLAPTHLVKPVEIRVDGNWAVPRGFIGVGVPACSDSWFAAETAGGGRERGLDALSALCRLREEKVDVVFNALHGPGGEDGTFQGLLRHAGFPFTGPDVAPASVTMDKRLAKLCLDAAGIRTPRGFAFPARPAAAGADGGLEWGKWLEERRDELPFPWIVKPTSLGSSVGVEVFATPEDFLARALEVGEERWRPRAEVPGSGFLVESVVRGRELTCGVIETEGSPRALSPIEIRPRASPFFDYRAKYTPGASEEICPAPLSRQETEAVEQTALRAHSVLECAPLSRTDLFLAQDGALTVLEVNTLPGMTETSLIPLAARHAGIPLERLFADLVAHALRRERARDSLERP